MKPDLILSAIIILFLIWATWTTLNVTQPVEQPTCEKEGSPMPQEYCTADGDRQ